MNKKTICHILQLFILAFCAASLFSEVDELLPTGGIRGTLVSAESRQPVFGALLELRDTSFSAVSDERGFFAFDSIPVGAYVLVIQFADYLPQYRPDIIVKSGRNTQLALELDLLAALEENISVHGGFFSSRPDMPASRIDFSAEEIRRIPGAEGDLSRAIFALPSVAVVNDKYNGLIVRGGSPSENAFYIDNIEIPNINHFSIQGASGGVIGLLNVEFIANSDFIAGGFPARFGNRLSSVTDIRLREGNRESLDLQLDLNMAGAGLTAEGPLGKAGSFMLSGRASYLDLISGMLGMEGMVPRYGDIQGKFSLNLGQRHRLTLLGIWGDNRVEFDRDNAWEGGNELYGQVRGGQVTIGVNWFALLSSKLYSETSISASRENFDNLFQKVQNDLLVFRNLSFDHSQSLRTLFNWTISGSTQLSWGGELKRLHSNYDYSYDGGYDKLGNPYPGISQIVDVQSWNAGGFIQGQWKPVAALTGILGLRLEHNSYSGRSHFAPRLNLNWQLSNRFSLHSTIGLYHQQLPLLLLYQNPDFRRLEEPRALQISLGLKQLIRESLQLSIEVYDKRYDRFPVDPAKPDSFILDFYTHGSMFQTWGELVSEQKARAYGIEMILQKKMKDRIYGMISASWFRTRYQTLGGEWKNREFDNRYQVTIQGGWRPGRSWELSTRWMLAGGTPYTPFDPAASLQLGQGVLDPSRINAVRKPVYHSLNLRMDHRHNYRRWNLVWYVSVWNVYNRRNVGHYFWDSKRQRPGADYQWGFLPVGGLEIEF